MIQEVRRSSLDISPRNLPIQVVRAGDSYQSYDDFRDSVLSPPAAVTTHNPKGPPLPRTIPSGPIRISNSDFAPRHSSLCSSVRAQLPASKAPARPQSPYHNLLKTLTKRKLRASRNLAADWFEGRSEVVHSGVSLSLAKEVNTMAFAREHMEARRHDDSLQTSISMLQRKLTSSATLNQVTSSNRFSWFGSRSSGESKSGLPDPADDELLNLDISAALYPSFSGREDSREVLEKFYTKAESILRGFQEAYRQRTFALHEMIIEKNEQQEELDETRTRIQHIKIQLDEMAEKALEQDKATKALAAELERERQARQLKDGQDCEGLGSMSEMTRRHAKRASSATLISDSGFESGEESPAESIFSRRGTRPGSPMSSITSVEGVPPSAQAATPERMVKAPALPAPLTVHRPSTYERVVKGLSPIAKPFAGVSGVGFSRCPNCRGVPMSEAWATVESLKEQNKGFKTRVTELESVIDDCIGLIGV